MTYNGINPNLNPTKEMDGVERKQREAKVAEDKMKSMVEKAKKTVKGIWAKRRQPWDGRRESLNNASTLEQLIEKVEVVVFLGLW